MVQLLKRSLCAFLILLILGFEGNAQVFLAGHKSISITDPGRNRTVTAEVYYPATEAGDDKPFVDQPFPCITLGHGFVMPATSYTSICAAIVSNGYVVILPSTETSFAPSHAEFGGDIAFLNTWYRSNQAAGFPPFSGFSAVGGHSMGGGASVLALETGTEADIYIGIAPAITNPSPLTIAAEIDIPAILFSGSLDAITPPENSHQLLYNALNSKCKTFVSLLGGSHCYYADQSICDLGEAFSQFTISRELQQALFINYLIPVLETFLKGNSAGWTSFSDSLFSDNRVMAQQNCSIDFTGIEDISHNEISIFPNPSTGNFQVKFPQFPKHTGLTIQLINQAGAVCFSEQVKLNDSFYTIRIPTYAAGMYVLKVVSDQQIATKRVILN
jgi:dienelactone hydrolase